MKRIVSLLLTMSMVFSFVGTTAFAADFSDIDGHWAESAIERWSGYDVVNGKGNGTFAPNDNMTRAEMAQIYVNLLHLTEKADISSFKDVPSGAWYADAIAKCVAAGILNGTSATTVSPLERVTREQMFVTFGRAMGLAPAASTDSALTDLDDVSDWAEEMVYALLDAGYVSGADNNTLLPLADINRASVVALIDQTVAAYGNEPGATIEMSGESGLALVVAGGVTVTGQVGDLVVAQGAAEGSVTLNDATVTGTVTVSAAAQLNVTGETTVSALTVGPAARGAEVTVNQHASVGTLSTAAENTAVSISGNVKNVEISASASGATVTVDKGATVGTVATAGANTSLSVSGTVTGVTVSDTASDTTVSTEKGSKVESVTTAGSGTTVSGSGSVSKVEAAEGSTGATVTTPGTTVENNGSGSVTTDKGTVEAGQTGTTSGGTTSGGGSSSGGGSVHTHSYTDGVCSCGAYDPAWAQADSAAAWNAAVEAGKNIIVTADFTADAQLIINKAITVNGNGKTVTAGVWEDPNPTSGGDASLVSIDNVTDAVVLKNITLTGAKHIVTGTGAEAKTDYASGLNVYKSGSVTLSNVTLSGNAAAGMVVNSSTVGAAGLHTSGNGWGGVNIDANVADTAASLTFDATSTFEEAAAVYSDKGGVTVNCPEGWAPATVDGVTVWSKLFNGGDGTAENPYQIATAEQFNNISALSDAMKAGTPCHFLQTADFVMTQSGSTFCGVYDGGNHSITAIDQNGWTLLFRETWGSSVTIENLTLVSQANGPMVAVQTNCADSLTFKNMITDSVNGVTVVTNSNNMGFLLLNALYEGWGTGNAQTYLFENITNNVNLVNAGTCTSPFVGSGPCLNDTSSSITYKNCTNNGDITGTSFVGFYYGNSAYIDSVRADGMFQAEGCVNNGILMATSDNGLAEVSLGTNQWVDAYEDIGGTGSFVSGSKIKDQVFSLYYSDGFQIVSDNTSAYTYDLVANISTIYWDDGYVSNGIKVVLPSATVASGSEGTEITAGNFTVYDKQTAIDHNIVAADETFTEQLPAGGYRYAVKVVDGTVYLVLDVGANGHINSDDEHLSTIGLYVYAYDNGSLVGTKAFH